MAPRIKEGNCPNNKQGAEINILEILSVVCLRTRRSVIIRLTIEFVAFAILLILQKDILAFRIHFILYVYILWNHNFYFLFYILIQLYHRTEYKLNLCSHFQFKTNKVQTHKSETENKGFVFFEGHVET